MSKRIEFGTKQAADQFRTEHEEWLCPIDDDKRQKTVALVSDAPDHVVERAEVEAAAGRSERSGDGGQVALTDRERDRIDFSEGRASVPHARSVKGIARSEGVDDWLAYYDAQLTVDEHRDVMEQAGQEGGGRRLDEDRDADDRLGDAEAAMGGQCDHARDHCEHGDPDACEFLQEACGVDEDRVAEILSAEPTATTDEEITGEAAGALGRSWAGYKAAIGRFVALLDDIEETKRNAEQAGAAINAIRADHGQDPLEFERLEELSDRLAAAGRDAHDGQAHIEQQQADGATNA